MRAERRVQRRPPLRGVDNVSGHHRFDLLHKVLPLRELEQQRHGLARGALPRVVQEDALALRSHVIHPLRILNEILQVGILDALRLRLQRGPLGSLGHEPAVVHTHIVNGLHDAVMHRRHVVQKTAAEHLRQLRDRLRVLPQLLELHAQRLAGPHRPPPRARCRQHSCPPRRVKPRGAIEAQQERHRHCKKHLSQCHAARRPRTAASGPHVAARTSRGQWNGWGARAIRRQPRQPRTEGGAPALSPRFALGARPRGDDCGSRILGAPRPRLASAVRARP
mmetsp:Transcript_17379/g.53177  ORF Transcript_17379/g.53177 Transcript_17379/m.53177 type:complete len:279 (-) Transcript_17379:132-968(-)